MIISFSHQKGGVGKSLHSFNTCIALDAKLIDLDTQQTITLTNNIRVANTLPSIKLLKIKNDKEFKEFVAKDTDEDLTVIDSGGFDSGLNRMAIMVSDLIITPVSDNQFELLGLKKYETILKELSNIKGDTIQSYVLLNNISPSSKNFAELRDYILKSPHFKLFDTVIKRRADFMHSTTHAKSIEEYKKFSKANDEFQSFLTEVKTILDI